MKSMKSIKLGHNDKIFRILELPENISELEKCIKKFFPFYSEKKYEIKCKLLNEEILVSSNQDYFACLELYENKKPNSIKFTFHERMKLKPLFKFSSSNNLHQENDTYDSELKSFGCSECDSLNTFHENEIKSCHICKTKSLDLEKIRELKKFTKSLSPSLTQNKICSNLRKNSGKSLYEQEKKLFKHKFKKQSYQAKILSNEEQFIFKNLKKNQEFQIKINFMNNGNKKWPTDLYFRCINGLLEGQNISLKSLDLEETFEVKIDLKSPIDAGRFHLAWRLGYLSKCGNYKYFGPRILNEFYVS